MTDADYLCCESQMVHAIIFTRYTQGPLRGPAPGPAT